LYAAVTRSQIVRLHNRFTALAKNDERQLTYVCNLFMMFCLAHISCILHE